MKCTLVIRGVQSRLGVALMYKTKLWAAQKAPLEPLRRRAIANPFGLYIVLKLVSLPEGLMLITLISMLH